ncbi:MAG TPA: dienelactone hydrolase family protein [Candidatus Angelobacter sp.]
MNAGSITLERIDPQGKGPHPAVMVVHGSEGPQGEWRKSGILEALTAAGYTVFVPHYFEVGEWTRSQADELFPKYIQALQEALRGIAVTQDIDKQKGIGLVGFSLGGYLVLGLGTDAYGQLGSDVQIKAVVELYGAMPKFAAAHMTTMPPVLIMHGANDETVSVSNAYALDKLLSEKNVSHEVKIYPEQGHGFNGSALKDSRERTVEFLKQYLDNK